MWNKQHRTIVPAKGSGNERDIGGDRSGARTDNSPEPCSYNRLDKPRDLRVLF
jgi:hypothetical protein